MGSGLRMAVRRVDPAAAGRSRVLSHTDGHSARRLASPRVNKPAAAGARTDVLQHLRLARAFGGPPVSRRRDRRLHHAEVVSGLPGLAVRNLGDDVSIYRIQVDQRLEATLLVISDQKHVIETENNHHLGGGHHIGEWEEYS
jgi:hypothetical protein